VAGVHEESTVLQAGGADVPVLLFRPDGHAPVAGVVVAPEAQGINHFIRDVGARLAREGYLAAVPDYYHGHGPEDPDSLTSLADLPVIQGVIDALDFRQGSEDMLAAVDHLHQTERLEQVAVWGYCTGGTLAMMAACQERSVDAAVLFYPSQPRFPQITPKRPQHPIDLVWQLRKPVLLVVGDEDPVWPADLIADIAHRCDQWSIPLEVSVYEGAGHTFAGHFEDWHRAEAAAEAWVQAIDFLGRCLS
jgi:carboxymethylenebutenolidase